MNNMPGCNNPCTAVNLALPLASQAPGGLTSPVNGTVTSWRGSTNTNTTLSMSVLQPVTGIKYTNTGTSAPVAVGAGVTPPIATSLPIKVNDAIGIQGQGTFVYANTVNASVASWFAPPLGTGESRDANQTGTGVEALVQATVEPTNTVTFGAVTRNKKKGTATLTVNVPNAGQLAYSGVGVNIAGPASVAAPGDIQLTIKATGKKRKKLNLKGKVGVTPTVTFTPNNGTAATLSTTVQLKKKLKKKL